MIRISLILINLALCAFTLGSAGPVAAQQSFANCGTESGSNCQVPRQEMILMRYGFGGKYVNIFGSGGPTIRCHDELGDLTPKENSQCSYRVVTGEDSPPTSGYSRCAKDGDWCNVGGTPDQPRWIRYGGQGKFTYGLASGRVKCEEGTVGDAVKGLGIDEHCYVGPAYTKLPQATKWDGCANEGQPCNLPASGPAVKLVRFGTRGNFTYKFIDTGGAALAFNCDNNRTGAAFGTDPNGSGITNQCAWANTPSVQIESVKGNWEIADQCSGFGCTAETVRKVGVERSNSTSNTKEWSRSVMIGYVPPGDTGGPTTSVTSTVGASKTLQETMARTHTKTDKFNCPANPRNSNTYLYQFQFKVLEACATQGRCESTIYTDATHCAVNPPQGPAFRPVCQPGCCKNDLCTTCLTQYPACKVMVNPQFHNLKPSAPVQPTPAAAPVTQPTQPTQPVVRPQPTQPTAPTTPMGQAPINGIAQGGGDAPQGSGFEQGGFDQGGMQDDGFEQGGFDQGGMQDDGFEQDAFN